MKKYYHLLIVAAALLCGGSGQAENRNMKGLPQRATDVIGMEVRNMSDEKLGKVDDLIVNLGSGRTSYVVLSSGGVFGIGDQLIVVPTDRFNYRADDKKLLLDADKDLLKNAPTYDKNRLPDWNDDNWNTKLEEYYDRSNTTRKDTLNNTRDNIRTERGNVNRDLNRNNVNVNANRNNVDRTDTAEAQGTSEADVETTRMIRKDLTDSKLSTAAKNVQVITRDGQVIVRGTVNSEQEKEEVLARAKRVAGKERVTDRVQVTK
jgi:sporulation protein YlmC with PRC-barrel domain